MKNADRIKKLESLGYKVIYSITKQWLIFNELGYLSHKTKNLSTLSHIYNNKKSKK